MLSYLCVPFVSSPGATGSLIVKSADAPQERDDHCPHLPKRNFLNHNQTNGF